MAVPLVKDVFKIRTEVLTHKWSYKTGKTVYKKKLEIISYL